LSLLLTSRLKQLNAHDAFFLLINCFSLPKLQYVLSCAPCFYSQVLHRYDNMIRDPLQSILNVELTESAWQQATLPVKNGGIGIRLATQVALAVFLSSIASSTDLILQLLASRLHCSAGVNDRPSAHRSCRAMESVCWSKSASTAAHHPPESMGYTTGRSRHGASVVCRT
jgi:hypothetical protein